MTRQEEIREVLVTLCAVAKVKDLTKSPTGFDDEVENAMLELHELGVVIKVAKPFRIGESINDDGLVAVEPLVINEL